MDDEEEFSDIPEIPAPGTINLQGRRRLNHEEAETKRAWEDLYETISRLEKARARREDEEKATATSALVAVTAAGAVATTGKDKPGATDNGNDGNTKTYSTAGRKRAMTNASDDDDDDAGQLGGDTGNDKMLITEEKEQRLLSGV